MLKRTVLIATFVLLLAAPDAAWAQGADWSPVNAEETKIYLDLPETEGLGVFFRSQSEDYSATRYLARYPTNAHKLDGALLVYIELSPGYHFKTSFDVDRVIDWTLKAGAIERGRQLTVNTTRGPLNVRMFSLDKQFQCGAFSQTWGQGGSMTTSAGSHRLMGYMCDESGEPVTEERIAEAAAAIIVRD